MPGKDITKINTKDTCPYRGWENGYSYIECSRNEHKCDKCGWNPSVEMLRKIKIGG